jgi:uncharacterized protein (DUF3820 family)
MLDDKSPMPFGKYKGQKMANVDAGYLLFLYNQNVRTRTYGAMSDVMVYINDNLEALKKEK